MLKDYLILDIETVPVVATFDELANDWKGLWIEKISKTVPENTLPAESWKQRAGILAEFGKIICISTAFFYEDENRQLQLRIKSIQGDEEREVLKQFIALCDKVYQHNRNFCFAGHNIREFDIPYICRRMLINGLQLPPYLQLHDKKPWEVKMFDTMGWWKFGDNKNYITLNLLAHVLGIPTSKTDMDGSMVQEVYYKERDLQRITEYCQRDVVVCANVILRSQGLPLLNDEQVLIVG